MDDQSEDGWRWLDELNPGRALLGLALAAAGLGVVGVVALAAVMAFADKVALALGS